MKRGQIYFIKSTYREEGSEQKADRPAVIVSNNKNNEHSDCVIVAYMTTKPKKDLPTHVLTRSAILPSTIMSEQIATVSKSRIGTFIGELTENELQALNSALMISLDLDFVPVELRATPTDEEHEEMKRLLNETKPMIFPVSDQSAALIKAEAERDIYRDLYHDLLEHMKGV